MTGSEDDPERSTDVGIYFAELAYKRGLENIAAQNRQIDDIRRRALGISGVTVTLSLFLFQSGLENGARVMSNIGIIALIVSALLAATVFYLVSPKPGWREFDLPTQLLDERYLGMTKLDALSLLVKYKTQDFEDNGKIIDEITQGLQMLLGLASLSLLLWAIFAVSGI